MLEIKGSNSIGIDMPVKVEINDSQFIEQEKIDEVMMVINSIDFTSISY